MHNRAIRQTLAEFAGHEIRNDGDSFTLAFHEAVDAVNFCLKVVILYEAVDAVNFCLKVVILYEAGEAFCRVFQTKS